jgi:hypothetical protein
MLTMHMANTAVSTSKQGMRNELLGVDKDYGHFYVFDLKAS